MSQFWNYHEHPYRPVEVRRVYIQTAPGQGEYVELPADVFADGSGRLWYAGTDSLRSRLPADPENEPKIPPEFWHPDAARRLSYEQHVERKHQLEDERIEGRRPQLV